MAIQCSAKDTTCQQLQRDYRFDRAPMLADRENQYKYVLDVDANYASGKFKRLMCVFSLTRDPVFLFILSFAAPADFVWRCENRSSRSLVFKSTIFLEWWSKRIMPVSCRQ